jgi:hypothetical protein
LSIKILGALALTATFALTACSNPTDGYSGKATIQETKRPSYKGGCILTVKTTTGLFGDVRVGRRTSCDGWHAGNVVFLQDGHLLK